ncbi:hypothetical protein KUV92_04130 [Priestia flexa]|nr:hypothetical protein [Priestia flexa]
MRKFKRLLVLIILIGAIVGGIEFLRYPIHSNAKDVEEHIRKWKGMGDINGSKKLDIREIQKISSSDTYVALFTIPGSGEGMAILKEGWSKRLRIEVMTKMNNLVEYDDIHTNKGAYALFLGKNPSKQIHRVKASLVNDNYTFDIKVPKGEYFISYQPVPKYVEKPFPADLILLNNSGDDITVKEYMDQELRE